MPFRLPTPKRHHTNQAQSDDEKAIEASLPNHAARLDRKHCSIRALAGNNAFENQQISIAILRSQASFFRLFICRMVMLASKNVCRIMHGEKVHKPWTSVGRERIVRSTIPIWRISWTAGNFKGSSWTFEIAPQQNRSSRCIQTFLLDP